MNYFSRFPVINYGFQNANGEYQLAMVNPTVHIRIVEKLKQSIKVFYDYDIQDDERPDSVSVKLYGSPDYTWILLLLNSIFSLFDWPLTNTEFVAYLAEKYGSLITAQTTYLYRTFDGYYVDLATWNTLTPAQQLPVQTVYDYELALNDAKRRIRIVPADFIGPLSTELKNVLAT